MKSTRHIIIWIAIFVTCIVSFFLLWQAKDNSVIDLTKSVITIEGKYTDNYNNSHTGAIEDLDLKSELSNVINNDSTKKTGKWQVIHEANKSGEISIFTDDYSSSSKLPIALIEFLLIVVTSIGTFSLTMLIQISVSNTKFKHIRNNHRWLLDFGFSRVHAASNDVSDFDYYISYLNLLTKGFEELNRDKLSTNKIVIKLFYPGTITEIIEKYKSGNIQRLYNKWNDLALNVNYEIHRFFISDKKTFSSDSNKTSFEEYNKLFPSIKPFFIDKDSIPVIIGKLDNRLDMAIFKCSNESLCIGFKQGEITYIVNNLENGRNELFNHSLQLELEYGGNTIKDVVFN